MQNIVVSNMKVSNEETQTRQMLVQENISGEFSFSLQSIRWFLAGLQLFLNDVVQGNIFDINFVNLIAKLGQYGMDYTDEGQVVFSREEIVHMKSFLEARMNYEEQLRDNRHPDFNADQYISMKYLLLDFKLWLAGDAIVEVKKHAPLNHFD